MLNIGVLETDTESLYLKTAAFLRYHGWQNKNVFIKKKKRVTKRLITVGVWTQEQRHSLK